MCDANEFERTESFWLKQAKEDLLKRDPLDAVNDVEELSRFAQERLVAIISGGLKGKH